MGATGREDEEGEGEPAERGCLYDLIGAGGLVRDFYGGLVWNRVITG